MNKIIPLTATSNFEDFISSGYYYVDKTGFIPQLEQKASKYLFYLRPRRFGKSLFLSMLEYYYGIQHRDKFGKLFSGLAVYSSAESNRNSYYTLGLYFSGIETSRPENILPTFINKLLNGISTFIKDYGILSEADFNEITGETTAGAILESFSQKLKLKDFRGKIFLLIDEYDHFTNELISFDQE
ncbi:MAG: AAA family ATPase, partial [Ignavibacteriaceae bacterium]|nr:AAA family ATPase [Ignavibacteriaceae bacterium]